MVMYDLTTLHFEVTDEDRLRRVGMSNYAEVSLMPTSGWAERCLCWSAVRVGVADAA